MINRPDLNEVEISVASGQVEGRFELAQARISAWVVALVAIEAGGARPGTSFAIAG